MAELAALTAELDILRGNVSPGELFFSLASNANRDPLDWNWVSRVS